MLVVSLLLFLFTGLIHANHGGKIIDYLLQQLKNATTDVRSNFNIETYFLMFLESLKGLNYHGMNSSLPKNKIAFRSIENLK